MAQQKKTKFLSIIKLKIFKKNNKLTKGSHVLTLCCWWEGRKGWREEKDVLEVYLSSQYYLLILLINFLYTV